jgi:hypothetical protein
VGFGAAFTLGLISAAAAAAPPQPDPYREALAEAREAERAGEPVRALEALRRATLEAGEVDGGPRTARALLEEGRIELAQKQPKTALAAFRHAHAASADAFGLRSMACARRIEAAASSGASAIEEKLCREARERDQKVLARVWSPAVAAAERKTAERELDEAARAYETSGDAPHAIWTRAVKARLLAWSGETEAALEAAGKLLDAEHVPAFARKRALEAGHRASVVTKDLDGETRYLLLLNALQQDAATPPVSPEVRRYARTQLLESACVRFDRSHGAGSCARLARDVTGNYSFHDHSRGRPKRSLSAQDLEQAQAQYLPLLVECIDGAARAASSDDPLFEDASLTIGWVVDARGLAIEPEISPHRYQAVLGGCVEERLGWFRYPRSIDTAERQSVSMPYDLRRR